MNLYVEGVARDAIDSLRATAPAWLAGMKIMSHIVVVDDDTEVREFLGTILKGAGHRVHEADNGRSAIGSLKDNPAELVVMDIGMPVIESVEAIRTIKQRFPHIKVIAISSYGLFLDLADRFGADRIFTKSLDTIDFLSAVDTLLQRE